jgi:hypothetical protein
LSGRLRLDFIRQRLPCGEFAHAVDRGFTDGRNRFLSKEGLVSGDDDVRKGKETLKNIVGNDGARQVAEEEICLLLIDIDPRPELPSGASVTLPVS